MAIDWSKPICTKHEEPRVAVYLGTCPVHPTRHRAAFACPSSQRISGTWRYDENGRTRGDGASSPADLTNYDPSDGVRRVAYPKER